MRRSRTPPAVDWHDLAACRTQFSQTYKRRERQLTPFLVAGGWFLPLFEARNPLTMIKETLPAGSFRGTKTIRLTRGSGMTLRRFPGRLPGRDRSAGA